MGQPRVADVTACVTHGVISAHTTSAASVNRRGSQLARAIALPKLENNKIASTTALKAYVGCPSSRIQRWISGIYTSKYASPIKVK